MKTNLIIRATFEHPDDVRLEALQEAIRSTLRQAFPDDVKIPGDIHIHRALTQEEADRRLRPLLNERLLDTIFVAKECMRQNYHADAEKILTDLLKDR